MAESVDGTYGDSRRRCRAEFDDQRAILALLDGRDRIAGRARCAAARGPYLLGCGGTKRCLRGRLCERLR